MNVLFRTAVLFVLFFNLFFGWNCERKAKHMYCMCKNVGGGGGGGGGGKKKEQLESLFNLFLKGIKDLKKEKEKRTYCHYFRKYGRMVYAHHEVIQNKGR